MISSLLVYLPSCLGQETTKWLCRPVFQVSTITFLCWTSSRENQLVL